MAVIAQLKSQAAGVFDELAPRQVEAMIAEARDAGWAVDSADTYCPRCGATVDASAVTPEGCPFCLGKRFAWQRVTRLGEYHEPTSEWIKAMKFGGQWRFARWFGEALAERVAPLGNGDAVLVVPVPMHWWRRTTRGFDQAKIMAKPWPRRRAGPTRRCCTAHGTPRRRACSRPRSGRPTSAGASRPGRSI